ncbi:MAG: hypothetical protein HQ539_01435 [Parcubacteria group bacterium]|nr:hypothetical protein [Parcubacteria group bacterium]
MRMDNPACSDGIQMITNKKAQLYINTVIRDLIDILPDTGVYCWRTAHYSGSIAEVTYEGISEGEYVAFVAEQVGDIEARGFVVFPDNAGSLANVRRKAVVKRDEKKGAFYFDFEDVSE